MLLHDSRKEKEQGKEDKRQEVLAFTLLLKVYGSKISQRLQSAERVR